VHRRTPENIERLLVVLRAVDAVKRADSRQLQPTSSWFLGRGHILLDTKDGPLDVLCEFELGQDYDWLVPRSVNITRGAQSIQVVDLPTLIELKTKATAPEGPDGHPDPRRDARRANARRWGWPHLSTLRGSPP